MDESPSRGGRGRANRPTVRQLRETHARSGFLWTRLLSQRLGAVIALIGFRRRLHPSTLTLASVVVGVGSAGAAIALLPSGRVPAGLVALIGWQLAYGLDCADGQLARLTGQATSAGARLDLTADYASHAATAATLVVASGGRVGPLVAVTAGMLHAFGLFDESTGRGGDAVLPTVDRTSPIYGALGLVRDSGAQRAAAGGAIMLGSGTSAAALVALGALGLANLLARLVALDRRSRQQAG